MNLSARTRRDFLKLAGGSLGSAFVGSLAQAAASSDEFGGLKMGIQSYTLRDRSFDAMLRAMHDDLKLHYVEL